MIEYSLRCHTACDSAKMLVESLLHLDYSNTVTIPVFVTGLFPKL